MIGLRRALLLIALAGLAWGAIAVGLTLSSEHIPEPVVASVLGVAVGWSFIGAGLVAWWRRPDNRVGVLMVGVGLAWFLTSLTGANQSGWFTAGVIASNVYTAIFVHLVLVYPDGRFERPWHAKLLAAGYAVALIGSLPLLLFGGPEQWNCDGCPPSALLIDQSGTLHDVFAWAVTIPTLAIVATLVRVLLLRWRAASKPRRRAMAPVLWSGVALLLLLGGSLTSYSLRLPSELADAFGLAGLLAFLVTPFGFLIELFRSRWARGVAVSEMLQGISASVGTRGLRGLLADALRDPSLEIVFWLDGSQRWVNEHGQAASLPAENDPRRAITPVELEGDRIGAIVYDRALEEDPELIRTVAAGAALAVSHERLQAQLRARVEDLRVSRARLAEAGVEERRTLERNLHDGAQQRLVALSLTLRLVQSKLAKDPEAAAQLLANGHDELTLALEELRELARGIHPAVLTDRGLPAALATLAGRSPVPVEVSAIPEQRLPLTVEAAAYYVVAEALTNVAKYANATHATVAVERRNGHAVIEVADDGIGGADPDRGTGLRGLVDRVSALDGRLRIESPPGAGTRLRAELPVT